MKKVTVRFTEEEYEGLKRWAASEHRSVSQQVRHEVLPKPLHLLPQKNWTTTAPRLDPLMEKLSTMTLSHEGGCNMPHTGPCFKGNMPAPSRLG